MKRKTRTLRNIVLVAASVATGLLMGVERSVGKEAVQAIPKTATIIPAPREMRVTGGEYWAKKPLFHMGRGDAKGSAALIPGRGAS